MESSTSKKYKPAIGGFVQPINNDIFNSSALIEHKRKVIEIIAEQIYKYDSSFDSKGKDKWFSDFWNGMDKKAFLDIATLNYDTCIEKSLTNCEDGYKKIGSTYYKFDPKLLIKKNKSRIMHLHWCINYGCFDNFNDYRHTFTDDFDDLYKYDTYIEASETWFNRSNSSAQPGEETIIGPIITGLRKTDKIITYHYNHYYSTFQNSLIKNNKLLIVGYSFDDKHFNKIINRISELHESKRKVVVITYCTPDEWCHDPSCIDKFNHEIIEFISKSFMEFTPFNSYRNFQDRIISKDKNVIIYFIGFKNTILKYGDEIVSFFNK